MLETKIDLKSNTMKLIREPENIEFEVDSRPITATEKKQISDVIAFYKKTRKIKKNSIAITKGKNNTLGRYYQYQKIQYNK